MATPSTAAPHSPAVRQRADARRNRRRVLEAARVRFAERGLDAQAQESGHLREDAVVEDVPMIICGLGHVTQAARAGEMAPGMSWERFLAIVLDGLRAPGSSLLPERTAIAGR